MAEQYVLRALSPLHQGEWDAFVEGHARGHLLQSWGWGELKTGSSWRPLRLALYHQPADTLVAVAQVLQRTALRVPARLGHLAYLPKGPVVDWTAMTPEGKPLGELFLGQLRAYLRKQGAFALQIEPHLSADDADSSTVGAILRAAGFRQVPAVQPLRTIALDLLPDEETLLARMKEKWRYNVRLAARKGVEVRSARSLADVRAWYALLATTGERDHFGIHTLDYYQRAWEILGPREQARLFLAYAQDALLAGIFVTHLAHEAIYLYGASSNAQRQLMPNYLLQWEAIRWAKERGARCYDFWGIPATDGTEEAMAGVYRFKSGWGGRVVSFVGNYEYAYHPQLLRLARRITER